MGKKKEKSIFLCRPQRPRRARLTPRQHALESRTAYWISAISNSAWRQALPGPPLILYCLATAVPVHVAPCPSPCNLSLPGLSSSNSTAVSIVNGYCYEWGPLLLFFFHWQAQGSQMDRLLLLLCYQDSPDTGPGLVEQSRRNDAPMGRGEGPRQRGWG